MFTHVHTCVMTTRSSSRLLGSSVRLTPSQSPDPGGTPSLASISFTRNGFNLHQSDRYFFGPGFFYATFGFLVLFYAAFILFIAMLYFYCMSSLQFLDSVHRSVGHFLFSALCIKSCGPMLKELGGAAKKRRALTLTQALTGQWAKGWRREIAKTLYFSPQSLQLGKGERQVSKRPQCGRTR